MAPQKKLENGVTLFARIEEGQYATIRTFAFQDKKSIAEIVREALDCYISARVNDPPPTPPQPPKKSPKRSRRPS